MGALSFSELASEVVIVITSERSFCFIVVLFLIQTMSQFIQFFIFMIFEVLCHDLYDPARPYFLSRGLPISVDVRFVFIPFFLYSNLLVVYNINCFIENTIFPFSICPYPSLFLVCQIIQSFFDLIFDTSTITTIYLKFLSRKPIILLSLLLLKIKCWDKFTPVKL